MKEEKKFRIIIATDNHIGFKEDHDITGEDSFNAFDEVLQSAKQMQANIVLLGGDLFHEAEPSQNTLTKTANILFKNVLGDGNINFSYEQKNPNFDEKNKNSLQQQYIKPNFACEDMNIGLPIFIINGNHDYPTNLFNETSPLDLLDNIKLLNYFGKSYGNSKQTIVEPLLFQTQGEQNKKIKVAIYGLGYQKEIYLREKIQTGNLIFKKPDNYQDYLNILVVHQNRFKGHKQGAPINQTIHESIFQEVEKDLFDLVIWGHEHECVGKIEESPEYDYMIYQPGSTVATKLFEGEMKAKGFGMLDIQIDKQVKFEQHYLQKSRRPFYYEKMDLKSENYDKDEALLKIEERVKEIVELIKEKDGDLKPIIRIKVEINSGDELRVRQLEEQFQNQVANPNEIVSIIKKQKREHQQQLQELYNNPNLNGNNIINKLREDKPDLEINDDDIHFKILCEFSNQVSKINAKLFSADIFTDIIERNQQSKNPIKSFEELFKKHISAIQQKIDKENNQSNEYLNERYMKKIDLIYQDIQKNLNCGQQQLQLQQQQFSEMDKKELNDLKYKYQAKTKMNNFQTQISQIISQQAMIIKSQSQQQNEDGNQKDELSRGFGFQIKSENDMQEKVEEEDQDEEQELIQNVDDSSDFINEMLEKDQKGRNQKQMKKKQQNQKKPRKNKKKDELNSSEDEMEEVSNQLKNFGRNIKNNQSEKQLQFDQKNLKNKNLSQKSSKGKNSLLNYFASKGNQQQTKQQELSGNQIKKMDEESDEQSLQQNNNSNNQFSKKEFNQRFLKQEIQDSDDNNINNDNYNNLSNMDYNFDFEQGKKGKVNKKKYAKKDPKAVGRKRKQEFSQQDKESEDDMDDQSNSNSKLTSKGLTAQKNFEFKRKSNISNMFEQASRR
ncbi:hypothetical protein PPERSA_01581 [Pseudocohnilembus persalinus]|uniref:Mre11 DNA-binding domain-containing protein n=1 Tax=Pseudocohnilembus persalinus TaxID=266149 RepID=A0A0V0QHJ3_PSEPJ|nr:hypothetical protein PPERSA_01581 [Pseudocohnilembus persalinus]|eukprot:KRX01711.1 hypothetical protein PPERSA_01581 [Pseudocohnilembus persalinus]